ncbi:uncharacterized protein N7525_005003 [Penicillium rubens]|uniref:uncharacterized protein n=1 Tax=Penicillium rubens TaxID=1108849 RepID=UPI002A59CDA0|nr:uncharacterized protein N7525_005003 [Penicillium rubens]KAJ5839815.1 hypothetical protein N7525_005003 [Penicillium rubens]KAJ5867808.1 hypothetical protein N7534_002361 [Penicillium rubens]
MVRITSYTSVSAKPTKFFGERNHMACHLVVFEVKQPCTHYAGIRPTCRTRLMANATARDPDLPSSGGKIDMPTVATWLVFHFSIHNYWDNLKHEARLALSYVRLTDEGVLGCPNGWGMILLLPAE